MCPLYLGISLLLLFNPIHSWQVLLWRPSLAVTLCKPFPYFIGGHCRSSRAPNIMIANFNPRRALIIRWGGFLTWVLARRFDLRCLLEHMADSGARSGIHSSREMRLLKEIRTVHPAYQIIRNRGHWFTVVSDLGLFLNSLALLKTEKYVSLI